MRWCLDPSALPNTLRESSVLNDSRLTGIKYNHAAKTLSYSRSQRFPKCNDDKRKRYILIYLDLIREYFICQ